MDRGYQVGDDGRALVCSSTQAGKPGSNQAARNKPSLGPSIFVILRILSLADDNCNNEKQNERKVELRKMVRMRGEENNKKIKYNNKKSPTARESKRKEVEGVRQVQLGTRRICACAGKRQDEGKKKKKKKGDFLAW